MSTKIAKLGIERDSNKMYFIKAGDVWAVPRKQPGKPKGKAVKVAAIGIPLDYSKYLYYVDGDGDVARQERAGGGRKKAKPSKAATATRSSISGHFVTEATAKRHPRTTVKETRKNGNGSGKSPAELQRDIDECLAKVRTAGYEVSDAPVNKTKKKARRGARR